MSRLKATILCIDDHWNGLIGRKLFLESNGYEVLEATDGDEGLGPSLRDHARLLCPHTLIIPAQPSITEELDSRECTHRPAAISPGTVQPGGQIG